MINHVDYHACDGLSFVSNMDMAMKHRLSEILKTIENNGNYRSLKYLKPLSATRVLHGSKEYLNLCSNSYLSLHLHPAVVEAAGRALFEDGAGTCSSRSVSGSIDLYKALEEQVAAYKGYGRGLVFSTGYMANIGIIATLMERDDVIFSDELNHSSLIDAMRLSRAKKVLYKHRDVDDLEKKIKRDRTRGRRFVVTESVFSMDGDVAPVKDIFSLKEKHGVSVVLDDAHGTGVFGKKGTGIEELFGLAGQMDVHVATFGKALGSFGAFVLADDVVVEFLVNRARTFMYTTALPPSSLAASIGALKLIEDDSSFKEELWRNIEYMRENLVKAGFNLRQSEGPIVPIVVGEDKRAVGMQETLMERGVFLQAIRPPTVPEGTSRLRLTVVRGLTREEMDYSIGAIIGAGKEMGLI
jgi:8-amino-7-oxononanoate synthase